MAIGRKPRQRRDATALRLLLVTALFMVQPAAGGVPLTVDADLQRQLDGVLADMEVGQAVADGRLAVSLLVFGDDEPRLAMINGHRMLYAASLPKIAILYGAAVSLDAGSISPDDDLHDDMVAMIRSSCNACATRVLDRIGREWLIDLLQSEPYRFYDPAVGGGLWVGKAYARGSAYRRDPLKNLSHAATAWQVARFYYLLFTGELVSPEQTRTMLDALSEPAIAHKFVAGLDGRVPGSAIYRKSGTWRNYHADSMLVDDGGLTYVLVALSRDEQGGDWLSELASRVHERLDEERSQTE